MAAPIKTLDMSLPSYGQVSDATATVETVKGLALEVDKVRGPGTDTRAQEASKKAKKKQEAAEEKARARAEFEQEKAARAVEVVDVSIPNYDESTSQSKKSAFSL